MGRARSKPRFGAVAKTVQPLHLLLCFSLLSAAVGCGLYAIAGYSQIVTWLWLGSILSCGLYFLGYPAERPTVPRLAAIDLWLPALLVAGFAPFYLLFLYDLPVQVNSDEVHILNTTRDPVPGGQFDLFGLSSYFGNPNLIFYLVGILAEALGGLDWPQIRLVNALAGLLIILFAYYFLREALESRFLATLGALLVGSQHALLAISRMGLRDNAALLFEMAALVFLLHGLRTRSLLSSYLGGAIAAIACYGYTPGRIAIVIWGLYLGLVFLFRSDLIGRLKLTKLGLATGLGFFLVIAPLIVSTLQNQAAVPHYHRQQFLFLPEGRALQQMWVNAPSELSAVATNIFQGLTAFNNPIEDHGNIYLNHGHGFFDSLSGLLLWVGVLAVLWRRLRKLEDLLAVTGFFTLLFVTSFVITKAPNYTRMLMFLPFTTCLVLKGLEAAAQGTVSLLGRWRSWPLTPPRGALMAGTVCLIAGINLAFYGGYLLGGLKYGQGIGNTLRYIDAKPEAAPYNFYIVTGPHDVYDAQGQDWRWWASQIPPQLEENHALSLVGPNGVLKTDYRRPATLFMNNALWREFGRDLRTRYPELKARRLTTNHLAVELDPASGAAPQRGCARFHAALLRGACETWKGLADG
ncbi:MAG: phospholipid carrier-dependent glycosyltransferase [Pseudomonadota bacterium]